MRLFHLVTRNLMSLLSIRIRKAIINEIEKLVHKMKKRFQYSIIALVVLLSLLTSCGEKVVVNNTVDEKKISFEELAKQEQQVLTSYALVDEKQGVYRIPIDRAMELIAADAAK